MSFPLFDLAKDLAVARSGESTEADDPRVLRRRIAGIAWAPGAILVVLLAAWSKSWLIGIAGIALLLIGLWLFAERAEQTAALARRIVRRNSAR
jgi:ABC-type nickel/cobalt efflux system permease component RcnA